MVFVKMAAVEGIPITNFQIVEAISLNQVEAMVYIDAEEIELESGQSLLSVIEYLSAFKAGRVHADKNVITPNGLDTATITAEVHPDLTEITFYHADTGEPITTVPVDPATQTATLQVTATTPGVILIRAGEPSTTHLNEVTIHAVEAS